MREIPKEHYPRAWAWWTEQRDRVSARASRCFLDRIKARYNAIPSWRLNAWMGIHSCEGAWTDSGDPYWGGLQMDRSFMSTYGPDALRYYGGLANVWAPHVQVVVADRAYLSGRGFYPWPVCGAPYR